MNPSTKQKRERITTPVGVFVYPKLNKPDTKFNADGVYSVKVRYTAGEAAPLLAQLQSLADAAYVESCKSEKKAKLKRADLPIAVEVDKDGNETGNYLLNAKLKAKFTARDGSVIEMRPIVYDAHRNICTKEVWGGSTGKLSLEVVPYFTATVGAGISLRLKAVQVISLVAAGQGGSAESFGFDKEDGYTEEVQVSKEGVTDGAPVAEAAASGEF